MRFSAKITQAREEFFLSENKSYMDIWFDILENGKKFTDRRLAFPMGTEQSVIETEIKNYCLMLENDILLSEKASVLAEAKAESEKTFENLKGVEIA